VPTPTSLRVTEHYLVTYRHVWRGSVVVSFIGPLLFLAAIGVGLGSLVDSFPGGVSYLDWVAPGLLASAAMQTAAAESTYPVMMGTKWLRTYHSMVATPVSIGDIVTGHLGFITLRLTTTAVVFAGMMAAFGVPGGILRLALAAIAAVLCGLAFAAPIAAWAVTRDLDAAFAPLFRFVIAPLFLFSGAFFPVSQLPDALAAFATVTPTWHGVSLCRDIVLGVGSPLVDVGHALYLALWAVGGWLVAQRTYARKLAP
jgi:lipooligosaccharide transport system permease protein